MAFPLIRKKSFNKSDLNLFFKGDDEVARHRKGTGELAF